MDTDREGNNSKIFVCLFVNITTFPQRLIAAKKKASNGINNNAYFNDAYCIGSGEQVLEMKCGDQAFSSDNVPDPQEHYYAAVNGPHSSSNHSAVILKFPDSLAGKKCEDVAPSIYQTLKGGVDAPIYQALGVDAPIYQALNNNQKSPEVRAEKTSEGKATPVCRSPNDGVNASIYQTLNNTKFSKA